ncbi:DHS-like NAD/FAD-binding domain-containing protein [Chlamydoabsidia padenii]|nr:DHS-like NAD/FAD-binding domain-containing protein [Chlamydoabsidia padenii]
MNPTDSTVSGDTTSTLISNTTLKRSTDSDHTPTTKDSIDDITSDLIQDRLPKRAKVDQESTGNDIEHTDSIDDDDDDDDDDSTSKPTFEVLADLGHPLFDSNYNEESDADWASGNEVDTESEDSSEPDLLNAALRVDDEVDVEESDEEGQYTIPWTSYTEEEIETIQQDAREIGLMKFMEKYVLHEHVPVAKLLQVFGIIMPSRAILLASDLDLLPILRSTVSRFLRKRRRLDDVNTLDDVVSLMAKAQNIMIVTGAGVSVSCGIPDFRSETGIYSRLQEYQLDDPQQMFDIEYFRDSPDIFYSFAKELYPSKYEPSPSHLFVKMVENQGKLLRNYTQNIDTLEHKANIKKVVNCHGSFATASCVTCGYKCDGKDIEDYIFAQSVPPCPKCPAPRPLKRQENDDDDDSGKSKGMSIMKPDITFFGEKLPDEFDHLLSIDTDKVDLLIVMGSSLKVSPVSEIMAQIPHRVPQILINRTPITHMTFDVQLLGNSDDIVPELCRMLNWDLRHDKLPGKGALSDESRQLSIQGDGDPIHPTGRHIWKYLKDGMYTFPGAVLDERLFGLQRCDERGSINNNEEDDQEKDGMELPLGQSLQNSTT